MNPKFRAWSPSEGKMFQLREPTAWEQGKREWYPFILDFGYSYYEIDFILMQWTGLTDVNNQDIYENDLVRLTSKRQSRIIVVSPRTPTSDYDWLIPQNEKWGPGWDTIEVIGNIYENPELVPDKWGRVNEY